MSRIHSQRCDRNRKMDDSEHGTVAGVCLYLSPGSRALETTDVAHRCDPRYDEAWRYCAYTLASAQVTPCLSRGLSVERITKIVKGSEVDRMAPRVIAAETIAAISYSANSLSSHPRRFGTAGTPGNVHPGNFGVVLLVPSPPPVPQQRFLS